jgi:transposase-like protein
MSIEMDEEIKRWTAGRKSALVLDVIQGKTTASDSSRQFDLPPSEIESWVDQAESGMENTLKVKPEDIRKQYESQLKALQEAYGEAMLELRAQKNGTPCWARGTRYHPSDPASLEGRRFHGSDGEALSLV